MDRDPLLDEREGDENERLPLLLPLLREGREKLRLGEELLLRDGVL